MARRKVEVKLKEIDNTLRNYKSQLKDAELDYEDAETRVLYFEDQIRRLKDAKSIMSKSKPKD
jgi:hypothetical protein